MDFFQPQRLMISVEKKGEIPLQSRPFHAERIDIRK